MINLLNLPYSNTNRMIKIINKIRRTNTRQWMCNVTFCGQTVASRFRQNLATNQESHEPPAAILYRYASPIGAHPNQQIHKCWLAKIIHSVAPHAIKPCLLQRKATSHKLLHNSEFCAMTNSKYILLICTGRDTEWCYYTFYESQWFWWRCLLRTQWYHVRCSCTHKTGQAEAHVFSINRLTRNTLELVEWRCINVLWKKYLKMH